MLLEYYINMRALSFFFLLCLFNTNVIALSPKEIITEKGIKFWFVEDKSVPIISIDFNFSGGAYYDPINKEGTSTFLAAILDEGAGEFKSVEFQKEMDLLGMKLSFSSSKDSLSGKFQTISTNKKQSFDLFKLALTKPRFDEEEIQKIRNQLIASYKISNANVSETASKTFNKYFFYDHNFSREEDGNLKSLKNINIEDLTFFFKNYLTKSNLTISVSGDIIEKDLKNLIDESFGFLPKKQKRLSEIISKKNFPNGLKFVTKETPQSAILFGHKGIARSDDNFFAARICNYIIGGGGFQSRLYKNIREKRGLAYSIYSYFVPIKNNDILLGGFQTKNESVKETIDLVKKEWETMAQSGLTQKELDEAKTYYKGSFIRNYTSTSTISSLLNAVQIYGLSINYFEQRDEIIDQITLEDVNSIAKKIFSSKDLYFVVVGGSS